MQRGADARGLALGRRPGPVLVGVDVGGPELHARRLAGGEIDDGDRGSERSLAQGVQIVAVEVEDEVSETVEDDGVSPPLPGLEDVRVVPGDEGGPRVGGGAGEETLLGGGERIVLATEVEGHDHEVGGARGRRHRLPDGIDARPRDAGRGGPGEDG